MIDIKKIDEAYKLYGFEVLDVDGVKVYIYTQGRYFGVDIFDYQHTNKAEEVRESYTILGYATVIKNYTTTEEVELDLFNSFFGAERFKRLISLRYKEFVDKQELALPESAKYEYIQSAYSSVKYDDSGYFTFEDSKKGDSVVDQVVNLVFQTNDKPLFVVIEAAAGFGKTCSSYELLHKINSRDQEIVPMYIELSRNREARIFKHILYNEIEKQFLYNIKTDIVIHEIKHGRIPLIIDGFDELLSKDVDSDITQKNAQYRDATSMLSTLVELLENKSKIIITSRRTAIFNNETFLSKMQKSANKYFFARFSLSVPAIDDWLNWEQINILKEYKFPINNISNPVLLSYIRNIPLPKLKDLLIGDMQIINKYFKFILARERKRQHFSLTDDEQLRILLKLASLMMELNITSEDKVFIKDIIKDYNADLLESYIKNCTDTTKPTVDDLADTLSNHALLDRKQNGEIGFINEFIMGLLIGKNIIQNQNNPTYASIVKQDFALLAISSYIAESSNKKHLLYKALSNTAYQYSESFKLQKDIYLNNVLADHYSAASIENITISEARFTSSCQFSDSVFYDCVFKDCLFSQQFSFNNSGFINCKFYNCTWIDTSNNNQRESEQQAYFVGCYANNQFLEIHDEGIDYSLPIKIPIEQQILEYFIRKDGRKYKDMVPLSKIRADFADNKKAFDKAISSMENSKLLALNGDKCFLLKDGVNYYREHFYHN